MPRTQILDVVTREISYIADEQGLIEVV